MNRIAPLLLRIGLAFVFIYPPISAFFDPNAWIWFVPEIVEIIMPRELFLHIFGGFQILLGIALLLFRHSRIPAGIAALLLAGITIANITALDVVFRDIGLLFAALALIALMSPKPQSSAP